MQGETKKKKTGGERERKCICREKEREEKRHRKDERVKGLSSEAPLGKGKPLPPGWRVQGRGQGMPAKPCTRLGLKDAGRTRNQVRFV